MNEEDKTKQALTRGYAMKKKLILLISLVFCMITTTAWAGQQQRGSDWGFYPRSKIPQEALTTITGGRSATGPTGAMAAAEVLIISNLFFTPGLGVWR